MPSRLLASNCSSPDPLSQSTGPTISSTPQIKRSPKKRRTTIISTPSKVTTTTTSSPWRFRVVVEAERDVDEDDDVDVTLSRGRKTQTRTTTTKIPLRGLSPEPVRTGRGKKRATPARPRAGSRSPSKTAARKSPTAKKTPAPKKTPRARRKATPVMPAEGEEYGRDEEEEEETPTPQIQEEVEKPAEVRNILFLMVIRYPEAIVSSHVYLHLHKGNIVNVSKPLFFLTSLHQSLQSRTNHLFSEDTQIAFLGVYRRAKKLPLDIEKTSPQIKITHQVSSSFSPHHS